MKQTIADSITPFIPVSLQPSSSPTASASDISLRLTPAQFAYLKISLRWTFEELQVWRENEVEDLLDCTGDPMDHDLSAICSNLDQAFSQLRELVLKVSAAESGRAN